MENLSLCLPQGLPPQNPFQQGGQARGNLRGNILIFAPEPDSADKADSAPSWPSDEPRFGEILEMMQKKEKRGGWPLYRLSTLEVAAAEVFPPQVWLSRSLHKSGRNQMWLL